MELQRLRHILCVADEGHFGRAAQRLGMAQPPLSQSIRRSERELGIALFERTPKGAVLTAAGRAFLPEARVAVAAAERATAQARSAVRRQPVRVGVASPALWGPLPTLLRLAQGACIPVELIEASTNDQLEALANGELDMGLLSPPFDAPPRLRVIDLSTDRLVAAMPERIAGERTLAPLGLLAERLILFPQRQGPFLHAAILNLFATHGLSPVIVQEARDMMPTLMLVAADLGSTLVPESLALRMTIHDVAFRPLADVNEVPTWPLAIAHMPLSASSDPGRLLGLWRRNEGSQRR
jgi:DNA-binding transcriptional LysR family regulator